MAGTAGPGHQVTPVVMWLGEYAARADGSPSDVPLVVSSHDNTPAVLDATGQLPPPGVQILPFTPERWFYQNFSHAMRVLPDAAPDRVWAPPSAGGPDGSATIRLYDGQRRQVGAVIPFPWFVGPVHAATGLAGGSAVFAVGAGVGDGPHVVVGAAWTGVVRLSAMAYDPASGAGCMWPSGT